MPKRPDYLPKLRAICDYLDLAWVSTRDFVKLGFYGPRNRVSRYPLPFGARVVFLLNLRYCITQELKGVSVLLSISGYYLVGIHIGCALSPPLVSLLSRSGKPSVLSSEGPRGNLHDR